MLLVANAFIADNFARTFDRLLADIAQKAGMAAEFWRPLCDPSPPKNRRFSHLILSGSDASIVDNYPWEKPLGSLLEEFIGLGRPVLGICYGHQFIVKTLCGKNHIRHAAKPEFGYRRIKFSTNPLFVGIQKPLISMVSHFDEVHSLGDGFRVLASTPDCEVQAFQYSDRPVWGMQFHPEYGPGSVEEIFTYVAGIYPDCQKRFHQEMKTEADLDQNGKIFLNFLKS